MTTPLFLANNPLLGAYQLATQQRRWQLVMGVVMVVLLSLLAAWGAEVDLFKFYENIGNFTSYIGRIFYLDSGLAAIRDPFEWFWGLDKWLWLLLETLMMAYVGTVLGALGAVLLCFMASKNMTRSAYLVFVTRRFMEFSRTVPEIVFALIFVFAFGLGPVAGVLAIAIHTMGALGKLFAEVVENVDMKPVQGVIATGGNWLEKIRFAVIPQVLSNFASYSLLRFEINVRGAAVLGFVGAGGIGETLISAIRKFYYSDVSALLILIILTVMIIDGLTEKLRHSLIGTEVYK
jgi:phosphonate transport system permease protein